MNGADLLGIGGDDRSVALVKRRRAAVGQLPAVGVMVAFTVTGLLLLFSG
ncbi:MAG TPA: hypothetical protein VIM19_16600 [Actinomycetes bacterium]